MYFPENKIYSEAESSCRDIGYNLIKINSKEKNEYVTNVVKSTTIGIDYIDVFIGMYCRSMYIVTLTVKTVLTCFN